MLSLSPTWQVPVWLRFGLVFHFFERLSVAFIFILDSREKYPEVWESEKFIWEFNSKSVQPFPFSALFLSQFSFSLNMKVKSWSPLVLSCCRPPFHIFTSDQWRCKVVSTTLLSFPIPTCHPIKSSTNPKMKSGWEGAEKKKAQEIEWKQNHQL